MAVRPIARAALLVAVAAPAVALLAADQPAPAKPPAAKSTKPATKPAEEAKDNWTAPMDYGPFLMTSVARPGGKPYKTKVYAGTDAPKFPVDQVPDMVAAKGIVIPLGPRDAKGVPAATVCFDVDTLAMAGGWTGGWLDLSGTMLTQHKGIGQVTQSGKHVFETTGPGWGTGKDGTEFVAADPDRPAEARGRFTGVHVNGGRVALSYRVGTTDVTETPSYEPAGDHALIVRTIRVDAGNDPITLALATTPGGCGPFLSDTLVSQAGPTWSYGVGVAGDLPGAKLRKGDRDRRLELLVPPRTAPVVFEVVVDPSNGLEPEDLTKRPKPADPAELVKPGPARWKPITVAGKVGSVPTKKDADPAFVVDEITLPSTNPYNSWFRLAGLDFFPDGRAAVCTINGDVWVASGLDDKLEQVTWTRHATGLYHPMGLKVVDGKICVRARDQLVRLHDLNADGEADFYENVSSEGFAHPSYHGFVFDLQADTAGNFYYARGGIGMDPAHAGHGRLTKLSADGKTVTPLAAGLRAPNGIGVVGKGWVTVSDNQGNWIPSSKISLVDPAKASPGGPTEFLGFLPAHHAATMPSTAGERPLVWVPHKLDNSSGGQCEVPFNTWGPYAGQWVHTSFGAACVMLLLPDAATPAGQMPKQAAVVRLPLDFATGVMRPRFNPKDGQLYVAGVGGGWQTKGTADGGLYRVRQTGKPGFAPTSFAVVPGGVRLTFAQPLDKTEAADVQNYGVEQWNYAWSEKYGSPDFSAKTPGKAGHDEVEVKSAEVSGDGRTVTLTLGDLRQVDQMLIDVNLKTAAGVEFQQAVYATVNAVPGK